MSLVMCRADFSCLKSLRKCQEKALCPLSCLSLLNKKVMAEICGQKFLWAQELVANEQEVRDKALADMTEFLSKQKNLSEQDSDNIWYFLWKALWMADGVRVQHSFCERICKILDVIPKEEAHQFIETFYKTMSENWEKLDKWRTEKYYVLGRKFTDKVIEYCKQNDDMEYIPQIIKKAITMPKGNSWKMHIVDVVSDYIPEFVKNDTKKGTIYLAPFTEFFTKEHGNPSLTRRINDRIITPLVDSIGEYYYGDDEEAALRFLRGFQGMLNYALKHPDPDERVQSLIVDKQLELRQILVAVNQKRLAEGKPIMKIDKAD